MIQDDHIAEYLKAYHCGEENTVSSREIESAFLIRGPDLRRSINRLRGAGIPICSTDRGYFYAATQEELTHTVRQLRSRIKKIAHAERGLARALEGMADSGQLTLPLTGGESD